jgi:hypothetical protein
MTWPLYVLALAALAGGLYMLRQGRRDVARCLGMGRGLRAWFALRELSAQLRDADRIRARRKTLKILRLAGLGGRPVLVDGIRDFARLRRALKVKR